MIKIIKNAISSDMCEYIAHNMELLRLLLGNPPDPTISNAFGYYSPIFLESFLLLMQPKIENVIGKRLYPTYSYGRIYGYGSTLERHTDRPSGEYAITCCIEKQIDWPILFEINKENVESYELNLGDICIYKGIEYPHWRNAYTGTRHIQVFLMYVNADGPYSEWKFDKRSMLGQGLDR
jgi:hypothetical protein